MPLRARRALDAGAARGRRLRAGALALRPATATSSLPERRERLVGGGRQRLIEALAAALRGARRHGRPLRPDHPAGARRRRIRPLVRAARRAPPTCARLRGTPGAQIELDLAPVALASSAGAAVDLGGIGKGFAADARARGDARGLARRFRRALVDLGGDIAVWGVLPRAAPGGSTSPTRARRARRRDSRADGRRRRHLGTRPAPVRARSRAAPSDRSRQRALPRAPGPLAVTVVAPSATEAEVHATALAVTDVDDAHDYLGARPDVAALLIPQSGEPIAIGRPPLVRERPRTRLVVTMQRGRTMIRKAHPRMFARRRAATIVGVALVASFLTACGSGGGSSSAGSAAGTQRAKPDSSARSRRSSRAASRDGSGTRSIPPTRRSSLATATCACQSNSGFDLKKLQGARDVRRSRRPSRASRPLRRRSRCR